MKPPMTLAIRELQNADIAFTIHLYEYQDKGGTKRSASELQVDEHSVIKTLIMETDKKECFVILMHGDAQVSTKEMARLLAVKTVSPASPAVADKHSGYQVGGTSPFGTKRKMTVYMEETILDLPKIYINGGKRGFLVGIDPKDVQRLLHPVLVRVATPA
ncbi:MAG: Cys-tRNA(Pro) deacylase [Proteobacteria bacterium]|nr:MAG: Cys-tRNA(Pro) deacylase [Pseudomonadota bacterium]